MGWFRRQFCPKSVYERRHEISAFWMREFKGQVQYGPLSGFQMHPQQSWSSGDLAPKLFGLYEQEVLYRLEALQNPEGVLIDIGAADGYYAVGVLASGLFGRVIAYEGDSESRNSIATTAALNGVSGQIEVRGHAEPDWVSELARDDLNGGVVLVDVEGAEFDLLGLDQLKALSQTVLIIELHDWMVEHGADRKNKLFEDLSQTHSIDLIKNVVRDLSGLSELETKNDDHRWLICSEGRGRAMEWLVCTPKQVSRGDV